MKKFWDLFYVDVTLWKIKGLVKWFDSIKSTMRIVKRLQETEDYMACLQTKNNILSTAEYDKQALSDLLAQEIDGLDDLCLEISLPKDAPITFQDIEIFDHVLSQFIIMEEGTNNILYNNNL